MNNTENIPALIRAVVPRLHAVLFIILFLSALTVGPRMLNIDGDLPRHLLMGQFVLETGAPPTQEIFSYVYEGRAYTPQEWLAGVIYYIAYLLLGLNGVVLLASILISATFTLLYEEAASQNSERLLTFLLMILGALATSIHWVPRPHLFTMLFLAIWLILVQRLFQGSSVRVWIFPVLMVLWANIHGEFIAGFLVLAAYLSGWIWQFLFDRSTASASTGRRLLSAFLLSLPASMLSPAGFQTWDIVFGYVRNRYLLSRIVETRPPDFTRGEYLPLLLLLGISILFLGLRKAKFSPAHFFLVAGFGIMSLLAARNAHLAGVVLPFILSRALEGKEGLPLLTKFEAGIQQIERRVSGGLVPMLLVILCGATLLAGPLAGFNRFEPSVFPVQAVMWLEDHPQEGRMFNAFDWGGYILLHLWPDQKTFIESHTDVTGEATQKYEAVLTLQEGWEKIFEEYSVTWAILPPDWPLTRELTGQGWDTVYEDGTAVILVKK
jgi:hypothetical protein